MCYFELQSSNVNQSILLVFGLVQIQDLVTDCHYLDTRFRLTQLPHWIEQLEIVSWTLNHCQNG